MDPQTLFPCVAMTLCGIVTSGIGGFLVVLGISFIKDGVGL
jgi:hypothetical protein